MRLLTVLLLTFSGAVLQAENWPGWRGPNHDGSTSESGLPGKFSPTEMVRWQVPMPGPAASTPVVWGEHVFVTSTREKDQKLLGICLDARTGAVRWEREIGTGFRQDERSTFAGPSPVTDGKRVIFMFGTGDLAAFDFAGKALWTRQLHADYGSFAYLWTYSSSPLLYEGRLYVQVLQRDATFEGNGTQRGKPGGNNESYLLALEPESGKELWRVLRPNDAQGESKESFTTPVPWLNAGRQEILVAGGDCLTGHDPATGAEEWRWGTWNAERISHWRLVAGPVTGNGVALVCAPKRGPAYALRPVGTGVQPPSAVVWHSGDELNSKDVSSDVATPLFYKGKFYVMNSDRKALTCVDPESGKLLWEYRVEGGAKIECSPTGADGRIFFMDQRGKVTVLAAGDEAKLLHEAEFGTPGEKDIRSSLAVAGGCLFVRTNAALFCVGK